LETYVTGRLKWLKPGGLMFPTLGTMFAAPFTDDGIYQEQMAKVSFWQQQDFYGLNLNCLVDEAMDNHFSQPVVGYFSPSCLLSGNPVSKVLNFSTIGLDEFETFDIPFQFTVNQTGIYLVALAVYCTKNAAMITITTKTNSSFVNVH